MARHRTRVRSGADPATQYHTQAPFKRNTLQVGTHFGPARMGTAIAHPGPLETGAG
ncbi:hypothetical protein CLV63_12316 [Murinocardiopsis flavida]|uniref:Uncharacterized protein n=1 Tax=Murinocardiopsis flavida TaxID=645275 RepID=A0A2P8CZ26_9ACTN|nr:hypothetical protein CLV63_12316 [Murinocardiopsis flavida]